MTLAQEIYESLLKDPDLDVGENQTREEFAKQEAEYRARQHYNNVEALSLANQPLKEDTPVINLLNYVKNLSKTVSTASVSIIQNIVKALKKGASLSSALVDAQKTTVLQLPLFSSLYEQMKPTGKAFLDALSDSNLPVDNLVSILNAIEQDSYNNPQDFADDTWSYDFIKNLSANPAYVGGENNLNNFHDNLQTIDAFSNHIPHTVHKPESVLDKNSNFYGTTNSLQLATKASIKKVNNLLSAAGHNAQVEFGSTGKLKVTGIEPAYNPHEEKSAGRLYGSMTQENEPNSNYNTAQSDAITEDNIMDYSVADILNGVNWLMNAPPIEKNTTVEDFNNDIASATEFEKEASSKLPPNQIEATDGKLAKGKPHVMFGGWGHKDFGSKQNQHSALKQAMMFGLCNEKGQLNTIGHILLQDAYDNGILGAAEVYEQENHVMLKGAGLDKLLEHHGVDITNGELIPSAIAEKISGMALGKEDMPDVNWEELASKIAGEVPEGGVPETEKMDNLILDTADKLGVSPTPAKPTTEAGYISNIASHIVRANAAINVGDDSSAQKHKDLLLTSLESGTENHNWFPDGELPLSMKNMFNQLVDKENQNEIMSHIANNTGNSQISNLFSEIEDSPEKILAGVAFSGQQETPDEVDDGTTPATDAQPVAETPKPIDTTVADLMNKHNDVIEHMYEQTYGKDNAVTSLEEFKADKAEEFSEMGAKKAKHEIAVGHNKLKANQIKESEKQTQEEAKEQAKTQAQQLKEEQEEAKQQALAEKQEQTKIAQEAKEEQAKTAKEEKEKIIQDKQKQKEASVLPVQAGDLAKIAGKDEDGNPNELPEGIATLHAMQLVAHQKEYDDHMTPKTQDKIREAMTEAQNMGADLDEVLKEMEEKGDDFGSPEHMKELHNKAVKSVEFHQNHKDLISGESDASTQALEDAIKHGSHGNFEEFDDEGVSTKPKEDEDKSLGHHHLLHTLDPTQQKHADDLKEAQKSGDKEAYEEAANALKESGVPEEDIHHMAEDGTKKDEPTGDGPPNPEVAKQKMAEGYVWHKETRHWILKETLEKMKGGHGGFDASIVSAGHQGKDGGAFALDENGNSSNKNFLFHGSGGLLGIGDGKPPKGGSISANGIAGNAIHNVLNQGGHLANHEESGTGMTKLQNFTHPNTSIGGGAGNSGLHHLNDSNAKPSGLKAQYKLGQQQGLKGAKKTKSAVTGAVKIGAKILDPTGISQAKFAANVISSGGKKGAGYLKDFISDKIASHKGKKFYGFEKSEDVTALSLLLEQYNPQDYLKNKRNIDDLLDSLDNDKEENEKRLEKSIITI